VSGVFRVHIRSEADVATASREGRALADRLGFSRTEAAHVATAISEVAGNVWLHAGAGTLDLVSVVERAGAALTVVASDSGPGIADVELAMRDGYSSRGGMGLGLPGARRLMDEFSIVSEAGRGTTVTMTRRLRESVHDSFSQALVDWSSAGTREERQAVVAPFRYGVLIAAVTGLGESRAAADAARAAADLLRERSAASPIALVERCHRALLGTGCAAMALASFSQLDARMTWLSVGSADCLLVRTADEPHSVVAVAPSHQGLVGGRLQSPTAATVPVMQGDVLGIAMPRSLDPDRDLDMTGKPGPVAEQLLERHEGVGLVVVARFLSGIRERRP
jgi:anti-sigma regulatory factor (Ser/Thr protein kinase)